MSNTDIEFEAKRTKASRRSPPRRRAFAGIHAPVCRFLGRYQPQAPCGEGGMSTVYRATDLHTGMTVAVKTIPVAKDLGRVQREIDALLTIEHPAVVRMIDFGFDQPTRVAVLVMEMVEGRTLRHWLELRRRLRWRTAVRLAVAVLDGLAPVHAAGLVHRDIKPSNLMVEKLDEAKLKIIDFGIVKPLCEARRITAAGTVVGTPQYMPPEQMIGQQVTPAADIYATGMVLWQMLTGFEPNDEELSRLAKKVSFTPRLAAGVGRPPPRAVLEVLEHMLSPIADERPDDVARCATLLRNACEPAPVGTIQARDHEDTVKVGAARTV